MNTKHTHSIRKQAGVIRRKSLWVAPVAFLSTLLALPVNATVAIPDYPLNIGAGIAPNILLILDDSGSMRWGNVNNKNVSSITGTGFSSSPDAGGVSSGTSYTTESTSNGAMFMQNYATNTLYYNPATTYQAWMLPTGVRLTGGTSYTSAYDDDNYATYDGKSGGSKNLSSNKQTFYVPKDTTQTGSVYLSSINNYYRYQFQVGGGSILRGEWGTVVRQGQTGVLTASGSLSDSTAVDNYSSSVSANTILEITIKNTTSGSGTKDLKYWVYNPSGTQITSGTISKGGNKLVKVDPTAAGTYRVRVQRNNSVVTGYSIDAQNYSLNDCDGSSEGSSAWINCTSATPTGRSLADEKTNFATWYSYHRTRIKAAKAGAAEAFRPMGLNVRVGFRGIRKGPTGSEGYYEYNADIPVGTGDGRFYDDSTTSVSNRTEWYKHLFRAYANQGTPLQRALNEAGQYYKRADNAGPYGPQTGSAQLSCRQNFTILTTDGYWNSGVVSSGNVDNTSGPTIKGDGVSYNYSNVNPYKDGYTNTLADLAMYYWKNDLRTESYMGDTATASTWKYNNVPTSSDDPAFWQHMVTFTIALGLETTKGWSSVQDAKTAIAGGDSWPDPQTASSTDQPTRLDDLLHAAVNGHGEFVSAHSPAEFADGLASALAQIVQRTSSFSNVATNSTSLNTGSQVFAASYVSSLWTGKVAAYPVTHSGGLSSTASWTSSIPAYASRKVFTYNGSSGTTFPTSTQTSALDRSGVGPANYEVSGADNAKYIMGDPSKEERNGGLLRSRATTVLGDIVDSSPAYQPSTKTLYVGANDGMLHAFDATNGKELFAYVPNIVNFTNLALLSRGDYQHKFFVDGPVVISPNTYISGKNYLVGTLGRGGKGVYALDVTTPASFSAGDVKWESASSSNMGNVIGAPIMGMVRNGTSTPAVVLGNGPNSTNDQAVLIVLNLQTGAVIKEIATDGTTGNALFAPTGIYAADGKTLVYVYAGDLKGNIWKFDLTNASPGSWTATKIFHAEKTSGTPQPITAAPAVAVDIATNKRWIFFGTGQYLVNNDVNDTSAQSMYGFIDDNSGSTYTRGDLTARSITVSGSYRSFEAKSALPTASKGWYVDLPGSGERIVQDAQINGSFMVTASMLPVGTNCDDAYGTGFINAIDAFTGTSGGKSMFDLNNDGSTDDTGAGGAPIGSVNTGVGMPTLPVLLPGQIIVGGSGDGSSSGLSGARTFGMSWQRVSWREIRND